MLTPNCCPCGPTESTAPIGARAPLPPQPEVPPVEPLSLMAKGSPWAMGACVTWFGEEKWDCSCVWCFLKTFSFTLAAICALVANLLLTPSPCGSRGWSCRWASAWAGGQCEGRVTQCLDGRGPCCRGEGQTSAVAISARAAGGMVRAQPLEEWRLLSVAAAHVLCEHKCTMGRAVLEV